MSFIFKYFSLLIDFPYIFMNKIKYFIILYKYLLIKFKTFETNHKIRNNH